MSPDANTGPLTRSKEGTVYLSVKATPGAKRAAIEWAPDHPAIRVRVNAPPADGAANRAVIAALAQFFKLPKRNIILQRGGASRDKVFRLDAISWESAHAHVGGLLGPR